MFPPLPDLRGASFCKAVLLWLKLFLCLPNLQCNLFHLFCAAAVRISHPERPIKEQNQVLEECVGVCCAFLQCIHRLSDLCSHLLKILDEHYMLR